MGFSNGLSRLEFRVRGATSRGRKLGKIGQILRSVSPPQASLPAHPAQPFVQQKVMSSVSPPHAPSPASSAHSPVQQEFVSPVSPPYASMPAHRTQPFVQQKVMSPVSSPDVQQGGIFSPYSSSPPARSQVPMHPHTINLQNELIQTMVAAQNSDQPILHEGLLMDPQLSYMHQNGYYYGGNSDTSDTSSSSSSDSGASTQRSRTKKRRPRRKQVEPDWLQRAGELATARKLAVSLQQ